MKHPSLLDNFSNIQNIHALRNKLPIRRNIMSCSKEDMKKRAITNSKVYLTCEANAALTINSLHDGWMDVSTLMDQLNESFRKVKADNLLEVEAILLSQAQTLNMFFHRCLSQVGSSEWRPHIQTMSDLALRAQNNCRKTLATLAEIKSPKRATFSKQQNNAIGNQQVNNSENSKKSANEVLNEVQHESLDDRSKEETITINPTLETVEAVHRR